MNCPSCGHSNLAGSAFCDNCGFDLSQAPPPAPAAPAYAPPAPQAPPPMAPAGGGAACPNCGTVAPPGAMFCDNCGGQLGSVVPGVPPTAPAWQQQAPPPAQPPYQPPAAPPTAPAWQQQAPPVAQPPYQAPPPAMPAGGGACPSCGQPTLPGAGFCDNCGANLTTPVVGPPPVYPPQQQTPVTPQMRMRLVVASSGVQLPLAGKQEFYIGREDPIGQFFPDADLTPHGGDVGGVSRRHAKIVVYGNQVMFEDLSSTNGSFVNKVKVQPGQPVPLTDGAEIRLGKVILLYQAS